MTNDVSRRNVMARQNTQCQFFERRHLRFWKGAVVEFVAGIDQLYTNGTVINIRLTSPMGNAGMPRPILFIDT